MRTELCYYYCFNRAMWLLIRATPDNNTVDEVGKHLIAAIYFVFKYSKNR